MVFSGVVEVAGALAVPCAQLELPSKPTYSERGTTLLLLHQDPPFNIRIVSALAVNEMMMMMIMMLMMIMMVLLLRKSCHATVSSCSQGSVS